MQEFCSLARITLNNAHTCKGINCRGHATLFKLHMSDLERDDVDLVCVLDVRGLKVKVCVFVCECVYCKGI